MTKYTNKQRKKVYKVKAKVKPTLPVGTPKIPKGKTKEATKERTRIIKEKLPEYYGVYWCPAINNHLVVNSRISLHKAVVASGETAKSAHVAMLLKEIIAKAEFIYRDKPKDNAGQKSFSEIWVLAAIVKGIGYAKLTVGKYKEGITDVQAPFCQYCIKYLSIRELKNKK